MDGSSAWPVLHSLHLARVPPVVGARALVTGVRGVPGLRHAECLAGMRLGAPVVSPDRLQLGRLAVFAAWESEAALDDFLEGDRLGRRLAAGWHVRLLLLRRWGSVRELGDLPEVVEPSRPGEPVVAVTLARTRLAELPRFLRWGRPVERQVRDHPGVTLALAGIRPPCTIATFSVWRSAREMTAMAHGRPADGSGVAAGGSAGAAAAARAGGASRDADVRRHAAAMVERERRDFHREFTTLRFRPLSEHGSWEGRTAIVPRA